VGPDEAETRARTAGAFLAVIAVSPHVVFGTPCTVKPAVDLDDAKIWSVARATVSPAGTATLKRRYALETGLRATTRVAAFP
jgi:hypothetical protein